jgi:Helix-turn-helix domain
VKERNYNIEMTQRALSFLLSIHAKSYKLSGDDWKILIILASYSGPYGIYPKLKNLCKELQISLRTLIRRLRYLASIGIIGIQKIGRINYYCLPFLYIPYSANLAPIIENWRIKLHNRCQSDTRIGANLAPTLISYIDNKNTMLDRSQESRTNNVLSSARPLAFQARALMQNKLPIETKETIMNNKEPKLVVEK